MLTILSPAKKLIKSAKPFIGTMQQPQLINKTKELATIMRNKTVEEIAALMDLSLNLAKLNHTRYQEFVCNEDDALNRSYPALFMFQGDVYQGLQASTWNKKEVEFAMQHLGILSGLYGFLFPLDGIQPYRLEMGVKLNNTCGNTLYDFWRNAVAQLINSQLAQHSNPILINLASNEYVKVLDNKLLLYPMVTINFYEKKNGALSIVGLLAKKARGTMARYIIQHHIDSLEKIKSFTDLGYAFDEASSTESIFNFVR